jgi:hypothetical protein
MPGNRRPYKSARGRSPTRELFSGFFDQERARVVQRVAVFQNCAAFFKGPGEKIKGNRSVIVVMFDFSKIFKDLKETIEIKDGPDELSLDVLLKDLGKAGDLDAASNTIQSFAEKDSVKQLLGMVGLEEKDVEFELEKIEGGMRYRFSSKEAKEKIKDLMNQLFNGDMLQKLIEGFMGTFANFGEGLGKAFGDFADQPEEDSDENDEDEN